MRTRFFALSILVLGSALLLSAASKDCSFLKNPSEFALRGELRQMMRSDMASSLQQWVFAQSNAATTVDAGSFLHKNFIDDSIFGRMVTAGIPSAPLSTDAEFLRRVTLDLTGRIPSAEDVQAFVAD